MSQLPFSFNKAHRICRVLIAARAASELHESKFPEVPFPVWKSMIACYVSELKSSPRDFVSKAFTCAIVFVLYQKAAATCNRIKSHQAHEQKGRRE